MTQWRMGVYNATFLLHLTNSHRYTVFKGTVFVYGTTICIQFYMTSDQKHFIRSISKNFQIQNGGRHSQLTKM